jgi:hypothetical protein
MYSEDQIERIKQRVKLAELAASYSYAIDGKTGYSRTSLRMKHHGKKIIVATNRKDGHGVFFYVDGSGGGSAIDFVMLEEEINFGQACAKLEHWLNIPSDSLIPKGMRIRKPDPIGRNRARVIAEWEGMQDYHSGFLEERGLSRESIALFSSHIRNGGKFNNTCFLHENETGITGFEVKTEAALPALPGEGRRRCFSAG